MNASAHPAPLRPGALAALLVLSGLANAQVSEQERERAKSSPIADALRDLGEDVRTFNSHVVTLSNPFMDGRVPGSRGMEIARDYMEYYLKRAGCEPPFETEQGGKSYRQPLPLGGTNTIVDQAISVGDLKLTPGTDFNALGLGAGGEVEAEAVFCGYGIARGMNGYEGFNDEDDLEGKIAVVLRWEPVGDDGKSQWGTRGRWSRAHSLSRKLRGLARLGPAAIVMVNTPGVDDPRADEVMTKGGGGRSRTRVPVLHVGRPAAERVLEALGEKRSLLELRQLADKGRVFEPLTGGEIKVSVEVKRESLIAQNVAGMLRGAGALKDEYIVIGAHLDHLGMGYFGSRSGPGTLHPGADDNASGSAAVLMLADKLARDYGAMGETPRRSILFFGFDAEESGLNGSRYYANNPIAPIEKHALMINFDMIGRVTGGRLLLAGLDTAKGLREFLQPIIDRSPLELNTRGGFGGGSDHASFASKRVPYLFSINDLHADYHTPRDVSWKINRLGATYVIKLYHEMALACATRTEPFEFQRGARRGGGRRPSTPRKAGERKAGERKAGERKAGERPAAAPGSRLSLKVRFGIMPESYEEADGVLVGGVTDGGPAAKGGVEPGDRLLTWNGKKIGGVRAWMTMLAGHEPGDKVEIVVDRKGEKKTLTVELTGRDG